jgi:hypothetical protein
MTVFDTPESIAFARMAARKSALSIEIRTGLRRSGRSAYSICKSEYGLKGSRESVLRQMQALVDQAIADKAANDVRRDDPQGIRREGGRYYA